MTIECLVCGAELKLITHTHLQKHGITVLEYKEKYPDAPLSSEEHRRNCSLNLWCRGLTAETDERIATGALKRLGHKRTGEMRKNMAIAHNPNIIKLTKKFLEVEYVERGKSGKEIGEQTGVGGGTVIKYVRKHNLPVRISGYQKGHPPYITEEGLRKIAEANRRAGRDHFTPEGLKRLSERMKVNNPMYNPKIVDKMIKSLKAYKADPRNHYNWQGGKSFEPYGPEFNDELKERIRTRDDYTCQLCGTRQEDLPRALDVHHIDFDKKNNDPKNLMALCNSCNVKVNYDRGHWTEYFMEMMA